MLAARYRNDDNFCQCFLVEQESRHSSGSPFLISKAPQPPEKRYCQCLGLLAVSFRLCIRVKEQMQDILWGHEADMTANHEDIVALETAAKAALGCT